MHILCRSLSPAGAGGIQEYTNWEYYDINGNTHWFTGTETNTGNDCIAASTSSTVSSFHGWEIKITNTTSAEVVAPNGWQFLGAHGTTEDTNGNYVTGSEDTTGTTMITGATGTNCLNPVNSQTYPSCSTFTVPSPGSGTVSWTEYFENVQASVGACSQAGAYSSTELLPAFIVRPDQFVGGGYAYYQFGYNSEGLMNSIRWPSGGTDTITYGSLCTFQDGGPDSLVITEDDANGNIGTTTLTRASGVTTVTFPDTSKQVISLGGGGPVGTPFVPTDWKYYDTGGSSLRKEVTYDWSSSPTTKITYLDGAKMRERDTTYSSFLPINITEIDWARDTSGNTKSITTFSYEHRANYIAANIVDKPTEIETTIGGGAVVRFREFWYDNTTIQSPGTAPANWDSAYGTSFYWRGNPTQVDFEQAALDETFTYDDTGQAVSETALNGTGVSTTFGSGSCANAYPTSQEVPGGTASMTHDCRTGDLVSKAGPNGNTTDFGYDAFNRLNSIADPDGGSTAISYLSPTETETQSAINGSQNLTGYSFRDGFGRPIYAQTADGDTTETVYNSMGQIAKVSNPYSTGNPPGTGSQFTATAYDGLGRPTTVTAVDGSKTIYSYTENATKITDPRGVEKIVEYGGFGHIWRVCEVSGQGGSAACGLPIAGNGFLTTYTYDMAGRLTAVSQGDQGRTWTYDTAGRMLTSDQPESGTTTYTYDSVSNATCPGGASASGGNLVFIENAASNGICLTYDKWNRLAQKTLSTGQTFTYTYDGSGSNGLGRMTAAAGPSDTMTLAYDKMGRPVQVAETNGGIGPYTTSYAYNHLGEPTSVTAPTGRVFNYSYDADARLGQIQDASAGTAYLGSVAYNPADEVTSAKFGGNALAMSASYNNMLQPFQIAYSPSGGGGVTLQFDWGAMVDANGNVTSDDNNGTLRAMNDLSNPALSMAYSYDDMNRLSGAAESDNTINVSLSLDQYGNRDNQTGTLSEPFGSSPATNQIDNAGFTYDPAGRLTEGAWAGRTYYIGWDALGELASDSEGDGTTDYEYDPFGRRISQGNGTDKHYAWFFYGAPGNSKPIAEYASYLGQGNWQTNVLDGGTVIATVAEANPINLTAPAAVNYLVMDANDTTRMTVSASGTVSGFGTFYPYGETGNGAAGTEYEWTNQIRDSNGVDHFPRRDYASQLARWLSPDPAGLGAVSLANPQSWNRYSYVLNNPASATDPLGLITTPQPSPPPAPPWEWADPVFRLFVIGSLMPTFDPVAPPAPVTGGSGGTGQAGPVATNVPRAVAACEHENLRAVNEKFGTDLTSVDVEEMFQYSASAPPGQGTLNLDISMPPQDRSAAISPGRYPVNWWTYVVGIGRTLHIPSGPGGLDSSQTLSFSTSAFTEHLDSAFPYNPIGFLFHVLKDILGLGGNQPCP